MPFKICEPLCTTDSIVVFSVPEFKFKYVLNSLKDDFLLSSLGITTVESSRTKVTDEVMLSLCHCEVEHHLSTFFLFIGSFRAKFVPSPFISTSCVECSVCVLNVLLSPACCLFLWIKLCQRNLRFKKIHTYIYIYIIYNMCICIYVYKMGNKCHAVYVDIV